MEEQRLPISYLLHLWSLILSYLDFLVSSLFSLTSSNCQFSTLLVYHLVSFWNTPECLRLPWSRKACCWKALSSTFGSLCLTCKVLSPPSSFGGTSSDWLNHLWRSPRQTRTRLRTRGLARCLFVLEALSVVPCRREGNWRESWQFTGRWSDCVHRGTYCIDQHPASLFVWTFKHLCGEGWSQAGGIRAVTMEACWCGGATWTSRWLDSLRWRNLSHRRFPQSSLNRPWIELWLFRFGKDFNRKVLRSNLLAGVSHRGNLRPLRWEHQVKVIFSIWCWLLDWVRIHKLRYFLHQLWSASSHLRKSWMIVVFHRRAQSRFDRYQWAYRVIFSTRYPSKISMYVLRNLYE